MTRKTALFIWSLIYPNPPALSKSSGEASKQLALSDLRKFAKVLLWPTDKLSELEDVKNLGPDPTAEGFDFNKFKERFTPLTADGKKEELKLF